MFDVLHRYEIILYYPYFIRDYYCSNVLKVYTAHTNMIYINKNECFFVCLLLVQQL